MITIFIEMDVIKTFLGPDKRPKVWEYNMTSPVLLAEMCIPLVKLMEGVYQNKNR